MSKVLTILLTVSIAQVVLVSSLNLTLSTENVRITTGPQAVSFTCTADVPITGCQFIWWDWNSSQEGSLLDLSNGTQSLDDDEAHIDKDFTGYSYVGQGLEKGDCGISMQLKGWKLWMVGCRVRAGEGGWKYGWTDLYTIGENRTNLPATLTTPREVVVLPGEEAAFLIKAGELLHVCFFVLTGNISESTVSLDEGAESADSTGRRRYFGSGVQNGECGLKLANVSEADNGPVSVLIHNYYDRYTQKRIESYYMALVVAHPPTVPTLNVTYTGTNVTATCEAVGSRPVAKMSWLLDDDVIRQDEDDDTNGNLQDGWRWPWVQGSLMQNVTLQLLPDNIGKTLKCRVSHVALDHPLEVTKIISSD